MINFRSKVPLQRKQFLKGVFRGVTVVMALLIVQLVRYSYSPSVPPQPWFLSGWEFALGGVPDQPQITGKLQFTPLSSVSGFSNDTSGDTIEHFRFADKLPGGEGVIWLRKRFTVPSGLQNKERLALLLGRVVMADRVWLNGTLIGASGRFPPGYFSVWNHYRFYPVAPALLQRTNILLVKVYGNAEGRISGPVRFAEYSVLEDVRDRLKLLSGDFNLLVAGMLFVFFWYHLLLYSKRPQDKVHLSYALLCISAAVYLSNFFISYLPGFNSSSLPYLFFQKLIFSLEFVMFLLMVIFLRQLLRVEPVKRVERWLAGITVVTALSLWIMPHYRMFFFHRNLFQLALLPGLFYMGRVFWRAARRREPELVFFYISMPVLVGCVLFDIIYHLLLANLEGPYLGGIGFAFFLLSIAGLLANRMAENQTRVESFNRVLGAKISERTGDLERSNRALSSANRQLRKAQEELLQLATVDSLTGVYNRRQFEKLLAKEIHRLERYRPDGGLALLFIDLDNFKYYNDHFGHPAGDYLLREFAAFLRRQCRDSDLVGRYGGDEFLVLLTETGYPAACQFVNRLYTALQRSDHFLPGLRNFLGYWVDVTDAHYLDCSIGMTLYRKGLGVDELLRRADRAVYRAKTAGKGCMKLDNGG